MKTTEQEQSYEALMARLVVIVERLEKGELSLADALTLYEEGMVVGQACEQHLKDVALRVEQLTAGPEGTHLEPWNNGTS
jgi:exodeoxyribonuclease VII small subunit